MHTILILAPLLYPSPNPPSVPSPFSSPLIFIRAYVCRGIVGIIKDPGHPLLPYRALKVA